MNKVKEFNNPLIGKGPEKDVVVSSRIRLARNLENFLFPNKADRKTRSEIIAFLKNNVEVFSSDDYMFMKMDQLDNIEKELLYEKNFISAEHARENSERALVINDNISVMINEEDHLRIQIISPGLNFNELWEKIDLLDDKIEEDVDYAFSEKLGYLTSCPTNVGTGLRASAMCHLPALTLTGRLRNILGAIGKFGLTVRGVYGEGSSSSGGLYQISNQITLGHSEKEIIENLYSILGHIIYEERKSRQLLINNKYDNIKDSVQRSLGILKYSHQIEEEEALKLLAKVKFGHDTGLIEKGDVENDFFSDLLINVRPAHLQISEENIDQENLNIIRSEVIKNKLI
ncbi:MULTISPECIES: protein arginine kinase [unclassified Halanaerobium]|uniref:protein arginine kinase n=1 Tax=unclassified Halanaerobium TaxID=2641197 RepID=UPI000DF252EE|nr:MULTISPECIES: protein arginine kinase [unclassified Halanaerobium]RCW41248.1 protein arginine kinase [Halanaerobium sp. MA284_MarDTE_T2]RCW79657.1 protein arginine kinase [Halanaerobium sp. DL-01]